MRRDPRRGPALTVTIDASVWVAARFQSEPGHAASAACLFRALATRESIVLPWLALVECVAAIARKTGDDALADEVGRHLRRLPDVVWVALDQEVAAEATEIAATCGLRAADAVYGAVARLHNADLVTLDTEMQSRCSGKVRCLSPEDWTQARST